MALYVSSFDIYNTEHELTTFDMWAIEKTNVSLSDFPGTVSVIGTSAGLGTYSFSMRRAFNASWETSEEGIGKVTKVAWRFLTGPTQPLEGSSMFRSYVYLSRTRFYATSDYSFSHERTLLTSGSYSTFTLDGETLSTLSYSSSSNRFALLWVEDGVWNYGETTTTLTTEEEWLDPSNYTLIHSYAVANDVNYRYVTFRDVFNNSSPTANLSANYLHVAIEYTPFTAVPGQSGGLDYYNADIIGSKRGQFTYMAPPKTR